MIAMYDSYGVVAVYHRCVS